MISYIAAHRLTAGAKVRSYLRKVPGGESIFSRLLHGTHWSMAVQPMRSPSIVTEMMPYVSPRTRLDIRKSVS